MASVGIRHLKNHLSNYIRRVEAGERIAVTKRRRVIAELAPPATAVNGDGESPDRGVLTAIDRAPLVSQDATADTGPAITLDGCRESLERASIPSVEADVPPLTSGDIARAE